MIKWQEQTPDRLKQGVAELKECRPEAHRINYQFEIWQRCFTNDKDLLEIRKRFGSSISRGNVIELGREAKDNTTYTRMFAMSVMIWGYGTVGYGATRTSKMLAHPCAVDRLIRGAELVRAEDFVDACLFFRNDSRGKLDQFSWSFFTKYFYFVGMASGMSTMPLILDGTTRQNGVAGGMQRIADDGHKGTIRAMDLWWSTTDTKCAAGYALYVELANW